MTRTIIYIVLIACCVLTAGCVDMKQERPKKQQADSSWHERHFQ